MTHNHPPAPGDTLSTLVASRFASRLWQRDVTLFAPPGAASADGGDIAGRLGWLDAATGAEAHVADLEAFAREIAAADYRDVYLLGMGGSSLCAEVFRDVTAGPPDPDRIRLEVLDTTDERRIGEVTRALRPELSLFLVASKSGGTIEVASLEQHFWAEMSRARGGDAGAHFVAITDPGTALAALGARRGYRRVILNPPDIGGRYAALSQFGLVPAALLGTRLDALAASAASMANRCRTDAAANPGLELGAFMASHARAGRDKLTLVMSPRFEALGPWIEQLVAESTGKYGLGVLPIVGEPRAEAGDYGSDCAFVTMHDLPPVARSAQRGLPAVARSAEEGDESLASWERRLRDAGHPVLSLESDPGALGGEFVRWEVATAAACASLGVNPFDQPDVELAKRRTRDQLDHFLAKGELRTDPELRTNNSCRVRSHTSAAPRSDGGYLAILDYLPFDAGRDKAIVDIGRAEATVEAGRDEAIVELRRVLRERTGLAVTHGAGPRYLHSTGQYHKGGPPGGRFVLVTSDDTTITMVPETAYSFSVLKHAQAWGDFEALQAQDRDVLHVHFPDVTGDVIAVLQAVVLEWLAS